VHVWLPFVVRQETTGVRAVAAEATVSHPASLPPPEQAPAGVPPPDIMALEADAARAATMTALQHSPKDSPALLVVGGHPTPRTDANVLQQTAYPPAQSPIEAHHVQLFSC